MIKSKISFTILFGFLMAFAFIGLLFYISTIVSLWKNSEKIPIPNIILLFFLFLFILFWVYKILKTTPVIQIDRNSIIISGPLSKTIEIEKGNISQINLFAAGMATGWITIVTRVDLINGKKIKIIVPNYRNIGELKQALVENFSEKIVPYNTSEKKELFDLLSSHQPKKIKGNVFLNFNTIMFGGLMIILVSTLFLPNKPKDAWFVIPSVLPLFYFILGYQSYYFCMHNEYFTIKNNFFFWVNKKYLLENIIAANFEYPGKLSKSLRITTKDFRSKYYSAGSLNDKDWKELKKNMNELGIHILF